MDTTIAPSCRRDSASASLVNVATGYTASVCTFLASFGSVRAKKEKCISLSKGARPLQPEIECSAPPARPPTLRLYAMSLAHESVRDAWVCTMGPARYTVVARPGLHNHTHFSQTHGTLKDSRIEYAHRLEMT